MEMTNTRLVPAPVDAVWRALNDPAALQACIPGCESLERTGEDEWQATLAARVGPVSAKFSGRMRMTDSTPPTGRGGRICQRRGPGHAGARAAGPDHADLRCQGPGGRQARANRIAADRRRGGEACRRILREVQRPVCAGRRRGRSACTCSESRREHVRRRAMDTLCGAGHHHCHHGMAVSSRRRAVLSVVQRAGAAEVTHG